MLLGMLNRNKALLSLNWQDTLSVLLAVSFHFLSTVSLGGWSLRIGSSDLVLPVLCVMFFFEWFHLGRPALTWRLPYLYIWLLVLTVWLLVSLVVGYAHIGGWDRWALVNKMVGWFILLTYFLVGGWIVCFRRSVGPGVFLRAYLVAGWGISAYCVVMYALYWHGVIQDVDYLRVQGFSDNPNAFGCIVAVMLALQLPYMANGMLFSPWVHRVGFAVAALALVFSGSRSAFLGLACAAPVLLVTRQVNLRETFYGFGVGVAIVFVLFYLPFETQDISSMLAGDSQKEVAAIGKEVAATKKEFYVFRGNQTQDGGVRSRLQVSQDAIRLWRQSPMIGAGLGRFYWEERQVGHLLVIHTTLLWLLTETGIIGVTLFVAFFLVCAGAIARPWRWGDHDPFQMGVLAVLLVVAGASVGTEMLYQRHVWFLLGCALAFRTASERTSEGCDITSERSAIMRIN